MHTKNTKTFVILGPTSSGKTSLSVELCWKFNGEIISADSRQVYKYMDIGTGKISVNTGHEVKRLEDHWKLNCVKVWGYDLIEPGNYFSAYDFAGYGLGKIREIERAEKTTFIAGGTGFYIDALTGNAQIKASKPDFELRKMLENLTLEELQKKLTSLNLGTYKKLDHKNPMRLIRAIEKELTENTTTTPLPTFDNKKFVYIGLTAERSYLYNKADLWLESVWMNGLIGEVQKLIEIGYEHTPQLRGLVYKTVLAFIKGELSETEAIQRTKYDLHSYIRRQQTWFKKMSGIAWFDIAEKTFSQNVFNHVESYLRR